MARYWRNHKSRSPMSRSVVVRGSRPQDQPQGITIDELKELRRRDDAFWNAPLHELVGEEEAANHVPPSRQWVPDITPPPVIIGVEVTLLEPPYPKGYEIVELCDKEGTVSTAMAMTAKDAHRLRRMMSRGAVPAGCCVELIPTTEKQVMVTIRKGEP